MTGSRERLWARYGAAWGRPSADIRRADDGSPPRTDAVVSWWVVDHAVGTDLERALGEFVPLWLAETWRFRSVHYAP